MAGGKWIGGSKFGNVERKFVPDRDNKKSGDKVKNWCYNSSDFKDESSIKVRGGYHGYRFAIRVPSLKRNKYTWKNFYNNYKFIYNQAKESGIWEWNGFKLKEI